MVKMGTKFKHTQNNVAWSQATTLCSLPSSLLLVHKRKSLEITAAEFYEPNYLRNVQPNASENGSKKRILSE